MSARAANYPTLSAVLWPENAMVRNVVLAVLGSLLLWVSARVQVPFYPVPLTHGDQRLRR